MWQTLITLCIIAIAAFFIGRKFYRLILKAVNPDQNVSCDCSCSGCNTTRCDKKINIPKQGSKQIHE